MRSEREIIEQLREYSEYRERWHKRMCEARNQNSLGFSKNQYEIYDRLCEELEWVLNNG